MDKLYDEIAGVAYELYEKRGRFEGCHVDDWVEAERIVMARHGKTQGSEGKAVKGVTKKRAAATPKEKETNPARKTSSTKGKKTAVKKKTL